MKFAILYFNLIIWPSVISVVQILMSAVCMAPAVSPVLTLKAPTLAPVWRDTCLSQTTALARPRMVSTSRQSGLNVHQFDKRL